MDVNNKAIADFVRDFFKNERFIQPEKSSLTTGEINQYAENPDGFQLNRDFMDRLLDDSEALEMIIDNSADSGNRSEAKVIPFAGRAKSQDRIHPLPVVGSNELKKVAASSELTDSDRKDAIQVRDEVLEGFLQIIEYKSNQYLISGHLTLFAGRQSLRLILPDGKTIENFKEEEGLLTFRSIVNEKIDLTKICYELY